MGKVAFALLWCFVLALPWDVLADLPVVGSIPRLVGLAAFAAGVLYILARRSIRPLTWFHAFALLFVTWAGVTGFWSVDPEATRALVATYIQLVILTWLIWEIAGSPERQRALLQAYVLGAGVAALMTIQNYLTGANYFPAGDTRFAALNQDPNELGLTLALGIPMAWYVSLLQPGSPARWLWRLYLPAAVAGILLTASRGATAAALLSLTIIPWTRERLRAGAKAGLVTLAAGSLVAGILFVPGTSLERIATTRADVESGRFGGRGLIWGAGLEVAREHPLVGIGAGGFQAAVEPALHQEMVAHDVPLSVLAGDGVIGLCLFLAMIAAAVRPLRRLPPVQQRFSVVLLLTLALGTLALSWDNRKPFWFVLGLVAVQVVQPGAGARSGMGEPIHPMPVLRIRIARSSPPTRR